MTVLQDAGWDNFRVPVPANRVECATDAELATALRLHAKGGANAGQSVNLYLSGTLYNEFGWYSYEVADGGTGLRVYGREDGTTKVRYTGNGMFEAANACVRVCSSPNQFDENDTFGIYNLDVDGNSSGQNSGSIWGIVIGASFDNDSRRSNCHNYEVQGNRIAKMQISALKLDGNGPAVTGGNGSSNGVARGNTIHNTNQRARVNGTSLGSGEGIYVGDGNTHRAYDNIVVEHNHIFDIMQGEALEFKRNGSNAIARYNLVHNVVVHSGGAIKNISVGTQIYGNVVYDIKTNNDSATNSGNAFFLMRTTELYNNVAFDCDTCVTMPDANVTGQIVTSYLNTFDARNGDAVFRINLDGSSFGTIAMQINSTDDIVMGNLLEGENNLNFGGTTVSAGQFVGPLSGSADAGGGPGTGYTLASGPARNGHTAPLLVGFDLQGLPRVAPTDMGAIDADATAAPATSFLVMVPNDGAIDVAAPLTISGSVPVGSSNVELRVLDGATVVSEFGDVDVSVSGDQWVADPMVIPQGGELLSVQARRRAS